MRKWFGRPDPAPAFLPFAERPARAAALRDLAEEIAKVWAQGRDAGLLERDESNGLALIATAVRTRAARVEVLGR
jgi:hypothetical protein